MKEGMYKVLSVALMAIIVASILPLGIAGSKVVSAATYTTEIETTRDAWGTVWKNANFTVYLTVKPAISDATLEGLYVRIRDKTAWVSVLLDFYDTDGLEWTKYVAKFSVASDGTLKFLNISKTPATWDTIGVLEEDDIIDFRFQLENFTTSSTSLTFKHYEAVLKSFRDEVPYGGALVNVGALDWEIEAPDLNKNPDAANSEDFIVTLTDYTIGKKVNATITFVETDDNSGVFKPSEEYLYDYLNTSGSKFVYNVNTGVWEPGTFNIGEIDEDHEVEVEIVLPQYSGASDVDTLVKDLTVFRFLGTVSGSATLKEGLTITVTDKAANYHSYEKDTVTVSYTGMSGTPHTITLEETDDDTGVFEETISIWGMIGVDIDEEHNEIDVEYTDTNGALRKATVSVVYHTATLSVSPETVVFGRDKITITIEDEDLNTDPDTKDRYLSGVIAPGNALEGLELRAHGVTLAVLSFYAVLEDGSEVPLTAGASGVPLGLTETGADTGVFTLLLDLSKVEAATSGKKITGIKVVYNDRFNADLDPTIEVEAEVSVAVARMELDRASIPLTQWGDPVIHVTVIDPEANTNKYVEDTTTVTVHLYDASDTEVWSDMFTLTETDVDTSEFTGTVSVSKSYLMPNVIGGKVVVDYETPESHTTLSEDLDLELSSISVSVNGTSSISVKYGDKIVITVEDPDRNLDASDEDEFTMDVGGVSVEFTETGDNTGVFESEAILVKKYNDNWAPTSTITFTYEDLTPTYATVGMTSWPSAYEESISISIVAFTAEISTDKTTYGPIGEIKVTVTDFDANADPEAKDSVEVMIQLWDGTFMSGSVTLEETDDNTGMFEGSIDISSIGKPEDIIGKSVRVVYRDLCSADGTPLTIFVTVGFTSWDPVMGTDKGAYNIGEKVVMFVYDPDANLDPDVKETITVRVTSTSDIVGTSVTLIETDANSGNFTGEVLLSDTIGPGQVFVRLGDVVTITYEDEFPADYGVTGESKTFTYEVRVGVPVEKPIVASNARFVDPMTGQPITPTVGRTVGIGVTLTNTGPYSEKFTVIMVVRDSTGAAVGIQWQTITLSAGAEGEAGFSFTPGLPGDYTVEFYIVKSLSDWTPLGETLATTMTVTE